jgi:hypothetical protein
MFVLYVRQILYFVDFEKLLTAFTADTPSEFIDYLLIDPQSVFLDYLSLNQIKTTQAE